MLWDVSGCFCICPDVFGCVWMCLDAFGCVWTLSDNFGQVQPQNVGAMAADNALTKLCTATGAVADEVTPK